MVIETVKVGYKQTESGIIPEDWRIDKIQNHANITTGSKNTQDRIEDGRFPFFVRSQNVERINTYSFDGEAVLTAGDGVGTGKVYHYVNGKFDFHQRVYKISNFDNELDGYFFFLYFSDHFLTRIMSMTAKSSVDSVRMDMIAEMLIPLPEKKEQIAIVETIKGIIKLIENLDKLIEKKRQTKLGVMQELLTCKKRLSGFNGDWKIIELKEIVTQFIVPMRNKPKQFRGSIPWCRIEDFDGKVLVDSQSNQYVDDEIIKLMNLKVHPKGTLLVSCSADLGRCAIVGRPLVSNQTFIGLLFNEKKASNNFFYYYLSFFAEELNKLSSGTTISYLSREQFETFKVKVPSGKPEQQAIAQVLSVMDAEIKSLEINRDKYLMIKKGMMQQLLTGKIRLK